MRIVSLTVAALGAVAAFGISALAQPPRSSPLETARAGQRILDQKAESQVRKAIDDASRLARSYPDKAIQTLRAAMLNLDLGGSGMSTGKRKELTAMLKARIASLQGKPATNPPGLKPDPAGPLVRSKKHAAWEAYLAEGKAVREGLDRIKNYRAAGQTQAADRVIASLAAKYPNHPSVISLTRKDNLARAITDARLYSSMASDRMRLAMMGVEKSAIPLKGDIEFPADWKDKAGKRKNPNIIPLSDKEKRIIEALNKPVSLVGKNKPLEYLLQEISTAMDQPLLIDKRSLEDLGIDLKKIGELDARNVTARTALRQVLASQGLTFVIKNETIQVVTVEKARDMLTTRVYYLGDVIQGVGPFGGGALWGPFLDFQQSMANAQIIVDAIQDTVDPLSWKKRGGPASVTFHFPTMSLIVRASSEVHASLSSKFGSK